MLCQSCGSTVPEAPICQSCGADVPGETPGRGRRRLRVRFGLLALVVALTAGGVTARVLLLADVHTVSGTLLLNDGKAFEATTGPCTGGGSGHDDLRTGAPMSVHGPDGRIVGESTFGQGKLNDRGGCVLSFTITDVAAVDYYQIRSRSTLGVGPTYDLAALRDDGWKLDLEVGDAETAARDARADCLDPALVDVSAKLVAKRVPFSTVAPGIDGDLWSYRMNGVLANHTGEDVQVQVAWEIRAYDSLLDEWGPFSDVVGDETTGVDMYPVAADGRSSFRVAGNSEQISSWNDFGKPGRVRLNIEAVSRAGTEASCVAIEG